MTVAIDARLWQETGVGRYIRNLVYQLEEIDQVNNYYILLLKKDYDQVKLNNNFQKIIANYPWYGVSEQIQIPKLLSKLNPDLTHFPHFNVPRFYNSPFVVTVHDLIHQHYQTKKSTTHDFLTYKIKTFGYKQIFASAVKKSKKIITPSNFVKNQLVSEWKVASKKITVTYEGVEDKLLKLSKENNKGIWKAVSDDYAIGNSYLYYVGNAHPHKNLTLLVRVFQELRARFPSLQLVLSGPDNYFWKQFKKEHKQAGIIYTGFVSDEELVTLYQHAVCLVLPSLEEGFGIPMLEAMSCRCPVVCSSAGSLPEVGGRACLYFSPRDQADLIGKVTRVIEDLKLRNELIAKGIQRCNDFSWQKLAQSTLEVYRQCV